VTPRAPASPRRGVCTIATRERLGYLEVLLEDLRVTHPGMDTFVLWAGETPSPGASPEGKGPTNLSLADLGLVGSTLARLKEGTLSDDEYLAALSPWLLQEMLSRGMSSAMFIADDFHVMGSLEEVLERAEVAGAGLVRRSPPLEPSDGKIFPVPIEHPVVEPHLLAVGRGGDDFLVQWKDACLKGAEALNFHSARFLTWAAASLPGAVLESDHINLGWWNLGARDPDKGGPVGDLQADQPALHLHGFDAWRPHLITTEVGSPLPIRLSDRPRLAATCFRYAERVRLAFSATNRSAPGTPGGAPSEFSDIWEDRFAAHAWDRARRAAAAGRWPSPPARFKAETARAVAWLNSPPDGGGLKVSRYLMEVYLTRPDLQLAFPNLAVDPDPFLRWARVHGRLELNIPPYLVPARAQAPRWQSRTERSFAAPRPELGVNVVGLLNSHLGLGEAARQLVVALAAADVPSRTWEYPVAGVPRMGGVTGLLPKGRWYPINLLCLNPPELRHFKSHLGPALTRDRYNIGIWAWETERAPQSWRSSSDLVDEVWAPSRFVKDALSGVAPFPIRVLPHAVAVPRHPTYMDRSYLGLPSTFLFLFLLDLNSSILRKNAVGLVRAFCSAFAPSEGPHLVIKTLNGLSHQGDFEELLLAAAGRKDVLVYDRVLSSEERAALLDACDCYVSLHRGEGFGLTLAESMALGKPVIATAYSGNLDFMTPENSYLVGYRRTRVGVPWDRYPADHLWAEPDLSEASKLLRSVWLEPQAARQVGARGRADVVSKLSAEAVGTLARQWLEEIWSARRRSEAQGRPFLTAAERVRSRAVRGLRTRGPW
jgi:glycosyltransferase involved in cell wall biosynthesis